MRGLLPLLLTTTWASNPLFCPDQTVTITLDFTGLIGKSLDATKRDMEEELARVRDEALPSLTRELQKQLLEEERKRAAEDEDASAAPTTEAHADKLHGDGICIAFLLYLTFAFNLWEWKTWEVVQFLVKPATERRGRCRFADLPYVKPFTGPATVFASHCWGGRWGDLVAAVCAGADTRRVVWIDIVAVRQWPGNGADLDFRGVIRRSHATIVAVAPVEGKLTEGFMADLREVKAFMESPEYQEAAKVLAFCRLWCLVEMFATLMAGKHLLFRGAKFAWVDRKGRVVHLAGGGERGGPMYNMLENIRLLVNVQTAECAVPEDRVREMGRWRRPSLPNRGAWISSTRESRGASGPASSP